MKARIGFILMAALFLFGGCAINRKISFSNVNLNPGYSNMTSMLLAVQDQRDQVIRLGQKTSWCGRNGVYNIQSESGKPVSFEFAQIISRAILKDGNKVESIALGVRSDIDSLVKAFRGKSEDRLLVLTIKNWETNCTALFSSMRYEVTVSLELKVYDRSGNLVADEESADTRLKEQGMGLNMAVLQALAESTLQEQIKKLFNKDKIKTNIERPI